MQRGGNRKSPNKGGRGPGNVGIIRLEGGRGKCGKTGEDVLTDIGQRPLCLF